ncbi:pyruvate decarboxylase [Ascodesmis nigricans]|uniref:Pyruvate decarboxylase n=1 Tax=Ascodesmis nigricans TaxID=341454 RepID=A0A4S2N6V1_9PEZI|nr:pyruvate decarboxylase [Ascodesmis nigricans]
MSPSKKDEVTVAAYLFKRLYQLGGDFNLTSLDLLEDAGLYWVGNCNELNASYAADGYARIKGISALMTTFGVGELSALNGIAGAYSEHVPVVHIVGMPNSAAQKEGLLLHHTLGNGDFTVYERMSREISQTTAILLDAHSAIKDIDRILRICWTHARPVYIGLPTDMVFKSVPAEGLSTPINLELRPNDEETEGAVVREICELMYSSKNTIILSDACAIRHRVLPELHQLMDRTNLPTFVSPMGKSSVNETHPAFGGVYAGDVSREDVKKRVEEADLVLFVGGLKSDFNSGGFTYRIARRNTIEFHSDHMKIRYSTFPGIQMNHVLKRLLKELDYSKIRSVDKTELINKLPRHERESTSDVITHDYVWPTFGKWFKEKDVIVTETGTANFGILEARFPAEVIHISQVLYGSIGYSVGALQGAALACKENHPERRMVLFVGDGSLQLTVQEIATMIRHGLKPIIFVINNNGYTIERMIHGMNAGYNDITPWKHTKLLEVLGANTHTAKSYQIKTRMELERLLADDKFSSAPDIQLVEIHMPGQDAPRALVKVGEITAQRNAAAGSVIDDDD